MRRLKITLFQEKDSGETQIVHSEWGMEVDSDKKQTLYTNIMKMMKEHNIEVKEQQDKFKELRRKR